MTTTPETDDLARGNHVVPTEFAQQLEIERDEARGAFAVATDQCVSAQSNLREAMKIADAMHSAMCAGAFDDGASVLFRKLQQRLKEAQP
jgi:hypothetical protein